MTSTWHFSEMGFCRGAAGSKSRRLPALVEGQSKGQRAPLCPAVPCCAAAPKSRNTPGGGGGGVVI